MTKVPNYLSWIKKTSWSLDEAISLINGEEPSDKYKNSRTYNIAIKAIKKRELKINVKNNNLPEADFLIKNQLYSVMPLNPRTFLEWAVRADINIHQLLKQFTNYDYWINKAIKKDGWSFNETIMLLESSVCPFPHEVEKNVFESKDTYNLAMKIKGAIKSSDFFAVDAEDEYNDGTIFILPGYLYTWLEKEGIDIPNGLKSFCESEKERLKRVDLKAEGTKASKATFNRFMSFESWTVAEGIWLLLGIDPSKFDDSISFELGSQYDHIEEIFYRSYRAGNIDLINNDECSQFMSEDTHALDKALNLSVKGLVRPHKFIEWCLQGKVPIKDNVKEVFVEHIGNEDKALEIEEILNESNLTKKLSEASVNTHNNENNPLEKEEITNKEIRLLCYPNTKNTGPHTKVIIDVINEFLKQTKPIPDADNALTYIKDNKEKFACIVDACTYKGLTFKRKGFYHDENKKPSTQNRVAFERALKRQTARYKKDK
jgi:hypothetical protein